MECQELILAICLIRPRASISREFNSSSMSCKANKLVQGVNLSVVVVEGAASGPQAVVIGMNSLLMKNCTIAAVQIGET